MKLFHLQRKVFFFKFYATFSWACWRALTVFSYSFWRSDLDISYTRKFWRGGRSMPEWEIYNWLIEFHHLNRGTSFFFFFFFSIFFNISHLGFLVLFLIFSLHMEIVRGLDSRRVLPKSKNPLVIAHLGSQVQGGKKTVHAHIIPDSRFFTYLSSFVFLCDCSL